MSSIASDNNAPHAYLTPHAETSIHDPQVRLLITNGELNATTADQYGLPTVGLSHGWKWDHDGALIDDLQTIPWRGRSVWLVPDSNVWTREPVLRQIYALGAALEREGAAISILRLPPTGKATTTLYQFLTQHDAAALAQLPHFTLTDPDFEDACRWEARWRTRHQSNRTTASPGHFSQISELPLTTSSSRPPFPREAWTDPFAQWHDIISHHTNAPDEFLWATFATAWGLILDRRVCLAQPFPLYANLWTLLIGQSARSRKSTMLSALKLLLSSLNIPYTKISGLGSIEGLATQMAKKPDQPTLLTEDEFRRFLGVAGRKVTANLIPNLQSLFSCNEPFDVTKKDSIHIEHPFLAFIAATPFAFIEDMLSENLFTGGLLNRFLLLLGEPNAPIPIPDELTPSVLAPLTIRLKARIDTLQPAGTRLTLTTEAHNIYEMWYRQWDAQLKPLPEHLQQLLERLPDHAQKLMLIYTTLEGSQQIAPTHLAPSLAIINYVQTLTIHHFQSVTLSHTGRIEEKVYRCIAKGKQTPTDIKHHLGGRVSTEQINRSLDALVKAERILKSQGTTVKNRAVYRYTLPPE